MSKLSILIRFFKKLLAYILRKINQPIKRIRLELAYRKRLKELRKKDPFIYK